MNAEELIARRNRLVVERDEIQKEIVDLYGQIKEKVLRDVIDLGLYRASWVYMDDSYGCYSTHPEVFFLKDDEVKRKVKQRLKDCALDSLHLDDGVLLSAAHEDNPSIRFLRSGKVKSAEFIRKSGLVVDFSHLDKQITELAARKNRITGNSPSGDAIE